MLTNKATQNLLEPRPYLLKSPITRLLIECQCFVITKTKEYNYLIHEYIKKTEIWAVQFMFVIFILRQIDGLYVKFKLHRTWFIALFCEFSSPTSPQKRRYKNGQAIFTFVFFLFFIILAFDDAYLNIINVIFVLFFLLYLFLFLIFVPLFTDHWLFLYTKPRHFLLNQIHIICV